MQDVGDVRAVKAVDTAGADGVIPHLWTTCKPQEPCSLCLANSSLMEEAWHRSHPLLVCATRISPMCTNGTTIKMGHTSTMCPFCKMHPQQAYTRENAQQFIAAGYDLCTRGMHKTILPTGRNN